MKRISEKDVEGALTDAVRGTGGEAYKNVNSPQIGGTPGMPDRTCMWPNGVVRFVECKAPDKVESYRSKRREFYDTGECSRATKTEIRQFRIQQQLEHLGFQVDIVGTLEEVDEFIAIVRIEESHKLVPWW